MKKEINNVKWLTVDSTDGQRELKQHAYIPTTRGGVHEDEYIGNVSLCGKIGAHDGDRYVDISTEVSEELREDCCKRCLLIFNRKKLLKGAITN